MRVAVISDIHGNLPALKAVLSDLGVVDALYCLGDMVGYGPEPNEVVEEIRRLSPDVVLMGNHDHAVITGDTSDFTTHAALAVEWTRARLKVGNGEYLSPLSASARFRVAGRTVGLYHGSPRDPLNEYIFPGQPDFILRSLVQTAQAEIVLLGHTHVPFKAEINSSLLANPGSVGQPRDGDPRASYAILDIEPRRVDFEIRRIRYDVDLVASRIRRSGLPAFLADRLYIGA
jgi:putative phosphoesterase